MRRFRFMQAKLIGFLQSQGQVLARYPTSDTSQPARYARAVANYRVSDLTAARGKTRRAVGGVAQQPVLPGIDGPDPVREWPRRRSIPTIAARSNWPNHPLLLINLARALTTAHGRNAPLKHPAAADRRADRAGQRVCLARTGRRARPAGRNRAGAARLRRDAFLSAELRRGAELRGTRTPFAGAQHALLPARHMTSSFFRREVQEHSRQGRRS
ncbi:MAG: hypothetical protein R3C16_08825 [Hyphomonadaceae bacterium]